MEQALSNVIERDPALMIPILLFIILGIVGIVAIVFGTIMSSVNAKEQERSRREIAAYIAEGSMTPEDGERLLTAGGSKSKKKRGCC